MLCLCIFLLLLLFINVQTVRPKQTVSGSHLYPVRSFEAAVHAGTAGPPRAPPSLNPRGGETASAQSYTHKILPSHTHLWHFELQICVLNRRIGLAKTWGTYSERVRWLNRFISALTSTKTRRRDRNCASLLLLLSASLSVSRLLMPGDE